MAKKNRPDTNGFVFSTNPDFRYEPEHEEVAETLPAAKQPLRVRLDTKQRAGKAVTLVTGFIGKPEDLDELGKKLKNICGTGGSVKDGEALIQGDQRDKVMQWLGKNGYVGARKL